MEGEGNFFQHQSRFIQAIASQSRLDYFQAKYKFNLHTFPARSQGPGHGGHSRTPLSGSMYYSSA